MRHDGDEQSYPWIRGGDAARSVITCTGRMRTNRTSISGGGGGGISGGGVVISDLNYITRCMKTKTEAQAQRAGYAAWPYNNSLINGAK